LAASPEVCEIDVPLGSDPLGIFDSWTEPFMDDRQSTLVASHRVKRKVKLRGAADRRLTR
jgi:hypothetical protein